MKLIKSLTAIACAVAFMASTALADQSCCVKTKATKGKDCEHKCCVEARKDKKTCDKCQKDASCCDKAIAKGEDCKHPCCVEAAKDKKVCEKCNPVKKEEKK